MPRPVTAGALRLGMQAVQDRVVTVAKTKVQRENPPPLRALCAGRRPAFARLRPEAFGGRAEAWLLICAGRRKTGSSDHFYDERKTLREAVIDDPDGYARHFRGMKAVSGTDEKGRPRHGAFKDHFRNGQVCCEGRFDRGKKAGEWKYFLANGQLRAIGHYRGDRIAGKWRWYWEDGALMQTGALDDGSKSTVFGRPVDG